MELWKLGRKNVVQIVIDNAIIRKVTCILIQ